MNPILRNFGRGALSAIAPSALEGRMAGGALFKEALAGIGQSALPGIVMAGIPAALMPDTTPQEKANMVLTWGLGGAAGGVLGRMGMRGLAHAASGGQAAKFAQMAPEAFDAMKPNIGQRFGRWAANTDMLGGAGLADIVGDQVVGNTLYAMTLPPQATASTAPEPIERRSKTGLEEARMLEALGVGRDENGLLTAGAPPSPWGG